MKVFTRNERQSECVSALHFVIFAEIMLQISHAIIVRPAHKSRYHGNVCTAIVSSFDVVLINSFIPHCLRDNSKTNKVSITVEN